MSITKTSSTLESSENMLEMILEFILIYNIKKYIFIEKGNILLVS